MPITSVTERIQLPPAGIIRLGVRQTTKSGAQFPTNVDHFVLTDAPGVESVYGKDPKEIEIVFLSDNIDDIIPTWLKWFSAGRTDVNGKAIGGDINCVGTGPDANGNPGIAQYFMARDPKTKVVPTRPCLQDKCPDWQDSKGRPKCKQGMQVIGILPRVTWKGVFTIHTSSWRSIRAFHNQLTHIKNMNGGKLAGIPFRIYRVEEAVAHTDQNGSRSVRNHHIMKIDLSENFTELYGKEAAARLNLVKNLSLAPNVSQENLLTAPQEDFYPIADNDEDYRRLSIERGETVSLDVKATKETIDDVFGDEEVVELFDIYQDVLGRSISPKARMIAIRQKEAEPNIREAVVQTLHGRIKEARDAAEKKKKADEMKAAAQKPTPVPPESAREDAVNSSMTKIRQAAGAGNDKQSDAIVHTGPTPTVVYESELEPAEGIF